jgi:hypothetical protein
MSGVKRDRDLEKKIESGASKRKKKSRVRAKEFRIKWVTSKIF